MRVAHVSLLMTLAVSEWIIGIAALVVGVVAGFVLVSMLTGTSLRTAKREAEQIIHSA
jgi:uncharacterized membrane-anchored protein YhcB (DUF1043 family)